MFRIDNDTREGTLLGGQYIRLNVKVTVRDIAFAVTFTIRKEKVHFTLLHCFFVVLT